jgi:hypothetical protein
MPGRDEAKVIIAGTGRAGTTLLVAILSDLGCDTGYRPGIQFDGMSGGLETGLRDRMPRIVKAPGWSTILGSLLDEGAIEVEHVIVPVRDLDVAAASRVRVAGYGRNFMARGGFVGARSVARQRAVLATMLADLVHTIAKHDLPHTFLDFPRFAHDWEYTYEKLGFLAPDRTADDFKRVIEARYDPSEIREEPLNRRERLQTVLLAPLTFGRRAARRIARTVRRSGSGQPGPARRSAAEVRAHVASWNTASATELCVRTMQATAGRPFELVVGDGGSQDGSVEMLEQLERAGRLELQRAVGGRRHAEWLNLWLAECPAPYAVFVDSDIVFRRKNWLRDMVDAARANDATLVAAEIVQTTQPTVDKHGTPIRWMPRPTPWMLLVDVEKARKLGVGFGFRSRNDDDGSGRRVMYDTGAALLEAVAEKEHGFVVMPPEWSRCYHHFGGLSWWATRDLELHRKLKLQTKRSIVRLWLEKARWRDRLRGAAGERAPRHSVS